jgi:hypothetical protein
MMEKKKILQITLIVVAVCTVIMAVMTTASYTTPWSSQAQAGTLWTTVTLAVLGLFLLGYWLQSNWKTIQPPPEIVSFLIFFSLLVVFVALLLESVIVGWPYGTILGFAFVTAFLLCSLVALVIYHIKFAHRSGMTKQRDTKDNLILD